MTALTIPSFERRLLRTVGEEVAAEPVHAWPEESLQLCLEIVRAIRENTANMRKRLGAVLAEGVEARSFARTYSPLLPTADDHSAKVRELLERLSPAEDASSESLVAELLLLEQETRAFRDLLAGALARASEAPRPADWGRVRAAEEAHARGETKSFTR
jgi:hypothetical protein